MQTHTTIDLPIRYTRRDSLRRLPLALAGSSFTVSGENGSPANTAAQTLSLDPTIGSALSGIVDDGRTAGASVLIWKDGPRRTLALPGLPTAEAGRRMTRDTIAQIYSMTKRVTGVALMQLWEQGKFGLDDPLYRYLPEFESITVNAGKDATGSPMYSAPCVLSQCGM